MRKTAFALAAMPALLALSAPTAAKGPVLGDLVLGEQITGPKVTLEDLKGCTVLAYFWSIH